MLIINIYIATLYIFRNHQLHRFFEIHIQYLVISLAALSFPHQNACITNSTLIIKLYRMPLPRTPLGPISSNRVYKKQKKELTPLQRSEIIGAAKCGVPKFMIADALHQDASTVSKTIKKATLRSNQRSLSRSGRPKTWTSRDQRRLVIFVRRNP